MPLSDQPFARIPEIETLSHVLKMNVSERERIVTAIASVLMMSEARSHYGLERWILVMIGAACAWRAFTGRCLLYQRLGIDTRHPHLAHAKPMSA